MLNKLKFILVLLLIFKIDGVFATIKLPALIGHGMVLQRDKPLKLWGWGAPDEQITVQFNGKTYKTKTDSESNWKITLPAMKAGGPYEMTIRGNNEIVLKDILLGDVWLCSGQSNMEFTMNLAKVTYAAEIANSENSQIRQFLVKQQWNFHEQKEIEPSSWVSANPKTVLGFTAAGYFFAVELYRKYHVPVGLINSSVGGTPAESWMSESALGPFPHYQKEAILFKDPGEVNKIKAKDDATRKAWFDLIRQQDKGYLEKGNYWHNNTFDFSAWPTLNIPGTWQSQGLKIRSGAVWLKKTVNLKKEQLGKPSYIELGNIEEQDTTYINGIRVGATGNKHAPRKYAIAAGVLKEGDNIITIRVLDTEAPGGFIEGKPYQLVLGNEVLSLKGLWKYQNTVDIEPLKNSSLTNFSYKPTVWYNSKIAPIIQYQIKGVLWYQGEANVNRAKEYQKLFPAMITHWRDKFQQGDFPFIFVQLASLGAEEKEPSDHPLAKLREAQTMTLALPNTGMAVTHDIGEWNDIHPQNKKDVGFRLFMAAQRVAYKEPNTSITGPMFKSVKIEGNKMIVSFTNIGSGLTTSDQKEINYFAVSGADKKFVWANAVLLPNNTIVVTSDQVASPVYVRYAWARNPTGANLSNKEGLPAVAFRTDKDN
ncbi:sialate O-acetylesterase [Pedobacter frigiditerrae]|uniref:sialate O-acetylesterase n=1 Tax=Pedobacter frigiditerrae TaxID=2530452 RepID=UPI00292D5EE6|nr:sialate O-acetylesterase [Pedobacter frigiditerrae]